MSYPHHRVDMNIDHVERNSSFSKMFDANFPDFDQSYGMFLFLLSQSPRPRTIKTHLSFSVLPPVMLEKTKVLHVHATMIPKTLIIAAGVHAIPIVILIFIFLTLKHAREYKSKMKPLSLSL